MIKEEYLRVKEFEEYLNSEIGVKSSQRYYLALMKREHEGNPNSGNIIKKLNVYYLKKSWINESLMIYNNSLEFDKALKYICETTELVSEDYKTPRRTVREKMKATFAYPIPLITEPRIVYISKDDINIVIDSIREVQGKECVYVDELVDIVNNKFQALKFAKGSRHIFKYIQDTNLEVIEPKIWGNMFISDSKRLKSLNVLMYPKETVDAVISHIKDICVNQGKVQFINMTHDEYFNLSKSQFEERFVEIPEDIYAKVGNVNATKGIRICRRMFKDTNVKCIFVSQQSTYVSKVEYEEFVNFTKDYVQLRNYLIENNLEESINITVSTEYLANNKLNFKTYKNQLYLHKDDIPEFIKRKKYHAQLDGAKSFMDKIKIKIDNLDNPKSNQFPKFHKMFYEYANGVLNKARGANSEGRIFSVYKILIGVIEVDLNKNNKAENDKLFRKAILNSNNSVGNISVIKSFNLFLTQKHNYNLATITHNKRYSPKEDYEEEAFLKLLIALIEIVADEENMKKLYRDWNLSTAVTYMFMHYTLAWRRMDFVEKLPLPDLRLIPGVIDGETFIQWLENGNKLDDKMAMDICSSIEEITKRLNLTANKNQQRLSCIISSTFVKEVATLVCISEANKQIHVAKNPTNSRRIANLFNFKATYPSSIREIMIEHFNIDINEILGESFSNVRMNKSFLKLVKDKAEELGLSYSYYYAQVSRGHKSRLGTLSNTTKMYLQKDISEASLKAFSSGTMGSVLHVLLELTEKGYQEMSGKEQIKAIKSLEITPFGVENNIMKITNKISHMKAEIDNYFKSGGDKKILLKDILYSQSCYGIEEKTKCLLKITRKNDLGIVRITSVNNSDSDKNIVGCPLKKKSCIGCDYMIALRYFIYEFSKRFDEILEETIRCETEFDKILCINTINNVYIPVLNDLEMVIGDEVKKVIDTGKYMRIAQSIT